MKQELSIATRSESRSLPAIRNAGPLLSLLGISMAGCMVLFSAMPIAAEKPLLLALGALALWAPASVGWVATLQQILCFYLVALLFNELNLKHVSLSLGSMQVSASWAVGPLLICAIGCYLGRTRPRDPSTNVCFPGLLYGLFGAGAIILVHAIVLGLLLHQFYGRGYEHSGGAVGHLAMYVLLFFLLQQSLAERRSRITMGAIAAAVYALSGLV